MERGAPGIALVSDVYSSSPGPCLCTCCFCALVGNGKVTLLEEPIHVVPCRHVAFNQQDLVRPRLSTICLCRVGNVCSGTVENINSTAALDGRIHANSPCSAHSCAVLARSTATSFLDIEYRLDAGTGRVAKETFELLAKLRCTERRHVCVEVSSE